MRCDRKVLVGAWCSGITPALNAGRPGLKPLCVQNYSVSQQECVVDLANNFPRRSTDGARKGQVRSGQVRQCEEVKVNMGVDISAEHTMGILMDGDVGHMDIHIVVATDCPESPAEIVRLVDVHASECEEVKVKMDTPATQIGNIPRICSAEMTTPPSCVCAFGRWQANICREVQNNSGP